MNMDMYNQVKEALKNGKSLDDIVGDISAMAAAAEQELKPQTPIADRCLNPRTIDDATAAIDYDHCKDSTPLTILIAAWLVENDVAPDGLFDSYGEFLDKIDEQLKRDLEAFKTAQKFAQMQKDGASDSQLANFFFKTLGDQLKELMN